MQEIRISTTNRIRDVIRKKVKKIVNKLRLKPKGVYKQEVDNLMYSLDNGIILVKEITELEDLKIFYEFINRINNKKNESKLDKHITYVNDIQNKILETLREENKLSLSKLAGKLFLSITDKKLLRAIKILKETNKITTIHKFNTIFYKLFKESDKSFSQENNKKEIPKLIEKSKKGRPRKWKNYSTKGIFCPKCRKDELYCTGVDRKNRQRYRCISCGKNFTKDSQSEEIIHKDGNISKLECPDCGSKDTIKRGYKLTKNRGKIQRYSCKKCNTRFIPRDENFRMRKNKRISVEELEPKILELLKSGKKYSKNKLGGIFNIDHNSLELYDAIFNLLDEDKISGTHLEGRGSQEEYFFIDKKEEKVSKEVKKEQITEALHKIPTPNSKPALTDIEKKLKKNLIFAKEAHMKLDLWRNIVNTLLNTKSSMNLMDLKFELEIEFDILNPALDELKERNIIISYNVFGVDFYKVSETALKKLEKLKKLQN